jgi:hypothetical protein
LGFPDPVQLYDEEQAVLEIADGRSTCNPSNPHPELPKAWDLTYTNILPGIYDAEYNYDSGNRLCFIIAGGQEVPTILPSFAHGWRSVASQVECHCSETEDWPGSKACLTIRKSQWLRITQHFSVGEKLKIEIKVFNE